MQPWRRHRSGLWLPKDRPPLGAVLDRSHPLAKGLVGAWLFNEAGGRTVFDLSGGRNHGTITGAAWQGRGLSFDGSGDYVRLQGAPINNQSWAGGITVFWFGKTGSSFIAQEPQLVSQDDSGTASGNFAFGIHTAVNARRLRFDGNNGAWRNLIPYSSGASLVVNTTYRLAATWDGTTGKGYINGAFDKSATPGAGALTTGQEINFMARQQGTALQTSGDDYAIYIYSHPLSAAEIAWLSAEPYAMFDDPQRRFLQPKALWTGIVFANRTPAAGSRAADGTQIKCDVTDNWYTLNNADITITVAGEQYTSADPEVSYETITNGKRIIWTPPSGYQYGRGTTVAVRVDAKNSHNDESYTEWNFVGKYYASAVEAEIAFFFRSPAPGIAGLLTIFRQAATLATQLATVSHRAVGRATQTAFLVRYGLLGSGESEPTVFVCEMKRIQGQGSGNVAEVELLAGEGSANIYGAYLLTGPGSANIQAFQILVAPAGSGDIVVTITRLGEGSADLGIPFRMMGPGAANIYKVEGDTYIRINALADPIKEALQAAGVIVE